MPVIRLDSQDVARAEQSMAELGRELERATKLVDLSARHAPLAQPGIDAFTDEWNRRSDQDVDGIETLALAFMLIGRQFDEADAKFAEDLRALDAIGLEGAS